MLEKLLEERNLPPLESREIMLETIQREEFGFIPPAPEELTFDVTENVRGRFCGGHARRDRVIANCVINGKNFSFPFDAVYPTAPGKHPFFIHINFRPAVPDEYMPTEEIIDNGFAGLSFCYGDVSSDDGDFTNGLAGVIFEDGRREKDSPGKIALWAWAAMRVMDFAQTKGDVLDLGRGAVCGHSRLGKTALLTAAYDERFACGYSNESGCSGAALARGTTGETVKQIVDRFPYWFCENYYKYSDNESAMPFDQHWLIACIAPRLAMAGSASLDDWAHPLSEQLAALAASPAFKTGLICEDRPAEVGEAFLQGDVGYHLRHGEHFFSRTDWQRLMEFMEIHK